MWFHLACYHSWVLCSCCNLQHLRPLKVGNFLLYCFCWFSYNSESKSAQKSYFLLLLCAQTRDKNEHQKWIQLLCWLSVISMLPHASLFMGNFWGSLSAPWRLPPSMKTSPSPVKKGANTLIKLWRYGLFSVFWDYSYSLIATHDSILEQRPPMMQLHQYGKVCIHQKQHQTLFPM